MSTWGSTTTQIRADGRYQPGYAAPNIVEIAILCDPAAPGTPASILQGNGRGRKTISFTGQVSSLSDYETLFADAVAQTVRTWTGPAGDSMSAVITELLPEYWQGNHVRFRMTLKEAS
jgi:hypothetical protein